MDKIISAIKAPPRYFHSNVLPRIRPSDDSLHAFAVRFIAFNDKLQTVYSWGKVDLFLFIPFLYFLAMVYGIWLAYRTSKKHGGGGYQVGLFTVVNDEGKVIDPGFQLLYLCDKTPNSGSASKQGTDEIAEPVEIAKKIE